MVESTKAGEYRRSIELFGDIFEISGPYFALAFLYDSQYERKDIKNIMELIESDKRLRKVHIQNSNGEYPMSRSREEYVPSELRGYKKNEPLREKKWSVGKIDGHISNGIAGVEGPFDTELEALEIVGKNGMRIICHHEDGTDQVIWWWHSSGKWIKSFGTTP
jgi:hypothetical protein